MSNDVQINANALFVNAFNVLILYFFIPPVLSCRFAILCQIDRVVTCLVWYPLHVNGFFRALMHIT